jgi:hypothetical protein
MNLPGGSIRYVCRRRAVILRAKDHDAVLPVIAISLFSNPPQPLPSPLAHPGSSS